MIELEKLGQVMRDLARDRGPFTLFGLFLRDEAPDKWDLVVSAPWLEQGKLKALGELTEKLSEIVGERELLSLSRIVTVNHDDPALEAVLRSVQVDDGPMVVQNSNLFGLPIKEAHIWRAKRPPQPATARAT